MQLFGLNHDDDAHDHARDGDGDGDGDGGIARAGEMGR